MTVTSNVTNIIGTTSTTCMKPSCRDEVEFAFTRRDTKMTVRLYSCRNHTDLFQELVLGVKYGNWESATFERCRG